MPGDEDTRRLADAPESGFVIIGNELDRTGLARSILSDAVTRTTRLEVRLEDGQHRLPAPVS